MYTITLLIMAAENVLRLHNVIKLSERNIFVFLKVQGKWKCCNWSTFGTKDKTFVDNTVPIFA